tara:strand:- start:37 stop:465 length:429 start_codon:yes stop_codon:yes gene_type:complete
MLNRSMKKLILLHAIVLILFHGCYPVSHIIIGEKKNPINANLVKVYSDFPDEYEKIAMIEASSDFAFKDMSLEITDQRKTDKALARLKEEAASLGANGIVIQSLSNKNKLHFSLRKDDRGNLNADTRNEKQKELNAIAIFVK